MGLHKKKPHQFGLALGFGAGSRVAAAGDVCGAVPAPGERDGDGGSFWGASPGRGAPRGWGELGSSALALLGAVVKPLVS